ncbi:MAG: flavodoxin family protein [Methanobrevibacter sp.]|jgi:multimeric flavodoxin WrbA|nr:flavodoxin family protein [Candidatus Methanoflexus mossambicus]
MLVLGICGSPRNQATEYVLKESLLDLEKKGFETKFVTIRGKKIAPCVHCDYCITNKECINRDDMVEIYDLLKRADGIIMASPMYNGGVSAQLKAVMDRCRALSAKDINILRGKVGMSIAIGGDRAGGQELAIAQINTYYLLSGIIPISGGQFGANIGACLWSQDTVEGVKDDEYGLNSLKMTLKYFSQYLIDYKK